MPNIFREIVDSAAAIAKGFRVTFQQMLGPTVTENYPQSKPLPSADSKLAFAKVDAGRVSGAEVGVTFEGRYRGVHVLRRDENGLEKCVACFLCAAACPSNCIYIEAAENTGDHRISAAERYAKVYNIDYNRCIFCGYCVEACPCDAITHGQGFEIAAYDTSALVWRKEQMLEAVPAPPAKQR
jgi:NADH-quinone oxidoreductase subunit I